MKTEENYNPLNVLNYLADSFWAALPEQTADNIATFKKDVLTGIRDGVNWLIDEEIKWTNIHVENARRMRREYEARQAAHRATGTPPVSDVPPNPAY